jgi:anti-sigma-K factor RskA
LSSHEWDEPGELDDAGLEALAEATATPPPPELRARVLAEIRRSADTERLESRLRRWRVASAAALAAAAALAVLVAWDARDRRGSEALLASLERDRVELAAELEDQQHDFTMLEDALAVQSEVMRILASPGLVTASLTPVAGGPGRVRVVHDAETGAVAVIGAGLPPPEAGRVYELWAFRGDGPPEPAGVLSRGPQRSFAVQMRLADDPRAVTQFAISLEPHAGAEEPTGPIVLAGSVDR